MTSITTIYNTSALFAYVFSVLLLAVPLEPLKTTAVVVATLGVAVVAYGGVSEEPGEQDGMLGDLFALAGAATYGFYEVIYKKYFSLPTPTSPDKDLHPLPFALHANLLTSLIGLTTLFLLALFIPVVSFLGWEPFELPPDRQTWATLGGVVLGGIGFNGSFMVRFSPSVV